MKVFKVTPKRIKRANGTVLTSEMTVTVTTQMHILQWRERSCRGLYASLWI